MVDVKSETLTGAEDVIWDLSVLYSGLNDPQIQEDMDTIEIRVDAFVERYKGRVETMSAADMVMAYQELEAIYDLSGRLGTFASLNYSTNSMNPQFGAFMQKIREYGARISQKLVFFELEWVALSDEEADAILKSPVLGTYAYHLDVARREKPYKLSEVEEQLLMEKSVTGRSAWVRLFQQIMAAMRFELDGEKLPSQTVLAKLRDSDRDLRKRAADSMTSGLRERLMELAFIFNVLAADKASDDNRRKYPSWISARNLSNRAPDEVVEALIQTVTSNYKQVERHYELKRRLMGYDELFDYDRYAPLERDTGTRKFTWDEAKAIVLKAFKKFDPRMEEIAQKFFDENWIHAPVIEGKRGGAFASPAVPSVHPFVLVNFTGTSRDVTTLAHELGHGIHMYLSGQAQTLFSLYTPLTTAETASVFAEMLVFQDLISKEPDKEVRLAMLVEKIEGSFSTVFRQVSMNRFEHGLHTARRGEGELSSERISEIWAESQKAMFGDSVNLRPEYDIWWSYVPHFLSTPGYVYAYAFGELLVLGLYEVYKREGDSFPQKYIDLLAAGDSNYPDKLLEEVGVDLNDLSFWQQGVDVITQLVDQEYEIARELYPDKF